MEELKKSIKDMIEQYTGVVIAENDRNFFDFDIDALDLLYVIRDIEEKYGITAKNFFSNADYHLLCINAMANRIAELSIGN